MPYGTLFVVATPIGNLDDITLRALSILKDVDMIAAEDTRHSNKLLQHFGIDKPIISVHEHNEQQRAAQLVERLLQGQSIALISDAGTPLISDPGYSVVKAIADAGLQVVPVPGACAAIAALSVSGLATDRFQFEGFLPHKSGPRRERIARLAQTPRTLIFYEAPHRIVMLFDELNDLLGGSRQAVVARELTKTYETVKHGSIAEICDWLAADSNQQRGEFVVIVERFSAKEERGALDSDSLRLMALLLQELPPNRAAQLAAKFYGKKKKLFYDYALDQKKP